jgi:4a-hydroxytetrahydrobiopterin dehydratase
MAQLASRSCSPQHGTALDERAVKDLLGQLAGWAKDGGSKAIHRTFNFQSYHAAIAFVNAVAWIAHREDHHPDMAVGYNTVVVTFSTHSVGGLSENDFICAAKIDALGTL